MDTRNEKSRCNEGGIPYDRGVLKGEARGRARRAAWKQTMKKLILYKGNPVRTYSVTCEDCKSSFSFTEDEIEESSTVECMVCHRGIDPITGVIVFHFGRPDTSRI
jgi:hypothetical protein